MTGKSIRFSPLAEQQLDALWDYGLRRFGERQADRYIDGLFAALEELATTGKFRGLAPGLVPPDKIADLTNRQIRFIHYGRHFIYFREINSRALGVICILGDRMDTPNQLKASLLIPDSDG